MENLLKKSFKEDRINKIELQEKKKKKKIELKEKKLINQQNKYFDNRRFLKINYNFSKKFKAK